MLNASRLKGLLPAIPTPVQRDGTIDAGATRALVQFLLREGIDGIVPRMIIAVGMFYFFARVGLVGTAFGLILGHTVVAVPYVVMTMMAVLKNYDTRLDLAAQSLGAGPWATLRHVTFPILAAGMFSSFLFAFATSFDELTIALFATGGMHSTLPKQFWDEVTLQVSPVIAAVSTCLFLFLAALIWIADRMRSATSPRTRRCHRAARCRRPPHAAGTRSARGWRRRRSCRRAARASGWRAAGP